MSFDLDESSEQLLVLESPVYVENPGGNKPDLRPISYEGVADKLQGARW